MSATTVWHAGGLLTAPHNVSTTIEYHFEQMPASGVGLLFMSFQASIVNQFEHIQKAANSTTFPQIGEKGMDLIISQQAENRHAGKAGEGTAEALVSKDENNTASQERTGFYAKHWNKDEDIQMQSFDNFVQLKGGEYFFAPSIPFLKSLAQGEKKTRTKKTLATVLAVLVFLLVSVCGVAQRSFSWADPKKGIEKSGVAMPVLVGEFNTFKITDINKFLYKVEIKGSVFELETPIPSELEILFRQTAAQREKSVENEKSAQAANMIPGAVVKMKDLQQAAKDTLFGINSKINNLKKSAALAGSASKMNELTTKAEALEQIIKELDKLIKACEVYQTMAANTAVQVLNLRSAKSEMISIAQMDKAWSAIMDQLRNVPPPTPDIRENYLALKQKYVEVEALYEKVKAFGSDDVLVLAQLEAVERALETVEDADELINQENLLALYADVVFLYSELQNENNFIVVAPPVQMDADLVHYTIKVTPSQTRSLAPFRNPVEFSFDVPTKGGLKVDFSVGPVFSFGHNAKDHKYYLEETTPGKVKVRYEENKNSLSPSIAAMMHFYTRSGKYIGFGGMLGIGAGFQSANTIDANLFTGVKLGSRKKTKINDQCRRRLAAGRPVKNTSIRRK